MCFGDPWEGGVPIDQVVAVGKRLLDLGAYQLSLGDTIGVGTAGHVTALLDAFNAAGVGRGPARVHFHDTYGQALSNAYAALRHGVTTFDACAGGLGGCPYAKSATGNLATEDLVWMLTGLGIEHRRGPGAAGGDVGVDGRRARPPQPVGRGQGPGRFPGRVGQHDVRHGRVVYLHVGAPKTGTTYLQDRLALNSHALARHDVFYPLSLHASQFRPALDLLDMPWGGLQEDVDGEWDALMGRVRRLSGTVVISHEILAAAKPAQVRKAMAGLEGSEVHLVYSARDLARQIPAEWQEGSSTSARSASTASSSRSRRATGPAPASGSGGCRACRTCSAGGPAGCPPSGCTW